MLIPSLVWGYVIISATVGFIPTEQIVPTGALKSPFWSILWAALCILGATVGKFPATVRRLRTTIWWF
jgi:hypothetical protein